jgi:hypothetical protein
MSTGLLYYGFHISDYKYKNVEYKNGCFTYQVLPNRRLLIRSNCKSKNVVKKGGFTRCLKKIPFETKSVFIKFFEHGNLMLDTHFPDELEKRYVKICESSHPYTTTV